MEHLLDSIVEFGAYDCGPDYIQVENPIFKQSIGPFRKGETVKILSLEYSETRKFILQEWDIDGNKKKWCPVKIEFQD